MSASLVARLIEAGTPAELVAEVAIELGRAAALSELESVPTRSSGAERTRRWRERKASQNVTVTSQASRDVTPSPPKNVPLEPPINTPLKISDADASAGEPAIEDPSIAERDLFVRGRKVLGNDAGGLIAKLKTHFGGNVSLARAAIETADTKSRPREYVGALLRSRDPPGERSNIVTLDAETGMPVHDRQPSFENHDPGRRSFGSGPRRGQAAAFVEGFCRGA